MLREVALFGGLAPSLLPYFFAAMLLFLVADQLIARLGVYRLVWIRHWLVSGSFSAPLLALCF
jgi:uncharacterized protein DUF1656